MYASLDRMDIGVEDDDGARIAIQTDHREPAEIEADFEMSAIFAITRAINPIRTGLADRVRFAHAAPPPERYLKLLEALGAEVEIMERTTRAARERDDAAVDRVARQCLEAIGRKSLAALGVFPDLAGLIAAQAHFRDKAFAFGTGPDEEPISYYEAMVELGAVTGLVLKGVGAYTWQRDPDFYGIVPYMIGEGSSLTNVFGKVERFFEHGDSQAPEHLLRLAEDSQGTDLDSSPVMFNLRPPDWAGVGRAFTRELLSQTAESEVSLPVVALVRDMPSSVASIPADTDQAELDELLAQAEANLARTRVQIERVDGELPLIVVHGSYYAAEKLLDVAFMANLAKQLDTELLMVSIPVKGRLVLGSAIADPSRVAALRALAQRDHDEAPPADRLTPEILLWGEGQLLGFARIQAAEPDDEAAAPSEQQTDQDTSDGSTASGSSGQGRGLFSRLFGRKR